MSAFMTLTREHRLFHQLPLRLEQIEGLRRDALDLLSSSQQRGFAQLKSVVFTLCESLRLHFHAEENRLWPHYNEAMSGGMERWLGLRARLNVKNLENEIDAMWAATSEQLRGRA